MKWFISFLCVAVGLFGADVLPTDRPASWEAGVYTGIPGGIPSGSWTNVYNVLDYGADPTGVASSQTAYNTARNDAGNSDAIIYFPEGTYLVSSLAGASRQAVRGDGMFRTIIHCTGSPMYASGDGRSWNNASSFTMQADVDSGFTRGSTSIDVTLDGSNSTIPSAGCPIRLIATNDWSQPVTSYNRQDYLRKFVNWALTVTSLGGNSYRITLQLPLPSTITAPGGIKAYQDLGGQAPNHDAGIEDLALISDVGSPNGVLLGGYGRRFWAKNVRVSGHNNYAFFIDDGCFIQLSGCFAQASTGGGSSHGMYFFDYCSGSLMENCIGVENQVGIFIQAGATQNAFAGNFIIKAANMTADPPAIGVAVTTNHEGHPGWNAFEHNIFECLIKDNYHGSSSHDVYSRNWIMGVSALTDSFTAGIPVGATNYFGFSFKKWSRHEFIAENILGTPGYTVYTTPWINEGEPNINNGNSYGNASLIGTSGASPWIDWDTGANKPWEWTGTLTTRTDSQNGVLTIDSGDLTALGNLIAEATANYSWWVYRYHMQSAVLVGGTYFEGVSLAGDQLTISTANNNTTLPALSTAFPAVSPGSQAFQAYDLDVLATSTKRANYNAQGTAVYATLGGGETVADSYIYPSGAPAYLTGYTFPPFNPSGGVGTLSIARIRAGQNYLDFLDNGEFDPGGDTSVATPFFSPSATTYSSAQSVTITCSTVGATIRYTIDGSTPTSSSGTIYSGAISIATTTTLKAIAYDGVLTDSTVRSGTYTITNTVETPTFSPTAGTYSSTQSVTISCGTSAATIHYTIDGSTPTTGSPTYSTAISISVTTTLKALAVKMGLTDSAVASGTYTITAPGSGTATVSGTTTVTGALTLP